MNHRSIRWLAWVAAPLLLLNACRVSVNAHDASDEPAAAYGDADGSIAVGTRVAAIWKDGAYYPGTVAAVTEEGYAIAYDDGDRADVRRDQVVPMAAPNAVRVGDHVLGVWKNGKMYPARVSSVSPGGATLAWDDGDTPMFVPEKNLAPIGGQQVAAAPVASPPSAGVSRANVGLQVGTRVAAKWKDGKYWVGEIAEVRGDQYLILYADGDRLTVGPDQIIPMAPAGTLQVGQHVMAQWKGATMFPGTITAIGGGMATVRWDDGDTPLAVPLANIAPF